MARSKASEKRSAEGVNSALEKFASRVEASNLALSNAMQNSLAFLQEVLHDDQRNRRFWRWVIIVGLVVNFGFLGALSYNAVQGAKARDHLLEQNRVAQQTLEKVDAATSPAREAEGQRQLAVALHNINCDNQRNIQRAMAQLGNPYELTEDCK